MEPAALAVGQQIGPYTIVALIGVGGMGEVYRAHDRKLGRDVAVKVLPASLASDPDRLARFDREARALATLNHPNIAIIHGFEHATIDTGRDIRAIVMELIEGDTLAQRLQRGPIPLADALAIARQIADALDAAHEKGIIHRDLKPANVTVTATGTVKVLDFGLAKAMGVELAGVELSQVPTVTVSGTHDGAIVGTAGYMSPEQARGQAVDKRTDIWAFGCILYELLTGRRAFSGDTTADTLAALLEREPDWQVLPASISAPVGGLLQRCLQKDASRRLRDIGDARLELDEALAVLNDAKSASRVRALSRPVRKVAVVAVAAVVLVVAAVLLWRPVQATPLTDKDVVVLADFKNATGEAIFDGMLREALVIRLEESPFLKILGDEAVRVQLRLMGRPADARITDDIARDICQREREKATIGGSIAALGTSYVITLQSIDCGTGETLAREQATAADKEHVLDAVATAAKSMRQKLGESLASIQALERPSTQVTTTSFEAFQWFSQGLPFLRRGDFLKAIPLFQRATDLDPNFASAWHYLAVAYVDTGSTPRVRENMTRAFELREREASERERFSIVTQYHLLVTGDMNKVAESAEAWLLRFPRDFLAYAQRSEAHWEAGEIDEALTTAEEAYRLAPRNIFMNTTLMSRYIVLDRFDDAREVLETELAFSADAAFLHGYLLWMAQIEGDDAGAARQIQWFAGKPDEYVGLSPQVRHAQTQGRLREADRLLRHANESRQRRGVAPIVPSADAEANWGRCAGTRTAAAPDVLPLALCGNAEQGVQALERAEDLAVERPADTTLNAIYLPTLRAAAELARNRPAEAIDLLKPLARYERARWEVVYLRGLSYLRARKGLEAAAEFQKLLDHKGGHWFYPTSYLFLARGAALAGDTERARRAYENLFARSKDADADIPILIEARKEYAALN